MKLYTEEQVKEAMFQSYSCGVVCLGDYLSIQESILNSLIPIELPSDEKIEKEAVYFSDSLSIYDTAKDDTLYGFREGANWVIKQIKKQK